MPFSTLAYRTAICFVGKTAYPSRKRHLVELRCDIGEVYCSLCQNDQTPVSSEDQVRGYRAQEELAKQSPLRVPNLLCDKLEGFASDSGASLT